jgi:hypothetical protein
LGVQTAPIEINVNLFSTVSMNASIAWAVGPGEAGFFGEVLGTIGPLMLADFEGRRADLEQRIDPRILEQLAAVAPTDAEVVSLTGGAIGGLNRQTQIQGSISRIRDHTGRCRGIVMQWKPAVSMSIIGPMAYGLDPGHLERVQAASVATRKPAAILFGDLEGSSALSKTMSTASYFNLVRRIVRTTDRPGDCRSRRHRRSPCR